MVNPASQLSVKMLAPSTATTRPSTTVFDVITDSYSQPRIHRPSAEYPPTIETPSTNTMGSS